MGNARNLAKLAVDSNGDVAAASLDNVVGLPDAIDVNASAPADSLAIDSSGNITVKDKIQFGIDAQTNIQAAGTSDVDLLIGADTNIRFETATNEQMRIDSSGNLKFNSGYGSVATAYGCRAWVNFNGTGTVAIRASGNVSSIVDFGAMYYGVNFVTAMPDANYSAYAFGSNVNNGDGTNFTGYSTTTGNQLNYGLIVRGLNIYNGGANQLGDCAIVSVSIFR